MPFHCWTSARYSVARPPHHRFPIAKYALLRDAVVASGLVAPANLHEPERASIDSLRLVHTSRYIDAVIAGTLSEAEQRRIGLPWSESLVERSFRAVGGTCEAATTALDFGVTMNLAGGTHHAFPDHGEGFGKQLVERRPVGVLLLQLAGFATQLRVGELRHRRLESVDLRDLARVLLEQALIAAAEHPRGDAPQNLENPANKI